MSRVVVIAEAGINHNGDFDNAKRLIDLAKDAGADFVKFQTFRSELVISAAAPKATYQLKNTSVEESQLDMAKKLEFSEDQFILLKDYADEVGIGFLSTAFDLKSLEVVDKLVSFHKIPSGEVTNGLYLKMIAKKGKPVLMSTGMCTLEEIEAAIEILVSNGLERSNLIVLHCNTEYPTPFTDVNIKAMNNIRDKFKVKVGYSDHTLGIEVPIAAVALGAVVIEKHFTIDRTMEGPDHAASLEPSELKRMVQAIRNVELSIQGSGIKERTPSESKNLNIARKSLHWLKDLPKGHRISEDDLIALRPGNGISPMYFERIIELELAKDVSYGQLIDWGDFTKKIE